MELLIYWNSLAGASPIDGILKLIDSDTHVLLPFLFSYASFNQLSFPFKRRDNFIVSRNLHVFALSPQNFQETDVIIMPLEATFLFLSLTSFHQ